MTFASTDSRGQQSNEWSCFAFLSKRKQDRNDFINKNKFETESSILSRVSSIEDESKQESGRLNENGGEPDKDQAHCKQGDPTANPTPWNHEEEGRETSDDEEEPDEDGGGGGGEVKEAKEGAQE